MSFWDFWKEEAQDYVHGWLDPSQTPSLTLNPVNQDTSYVTVKLRKMRIVNVRVGFKRFYATVHSDIGLWHASGRKINFKQMIAPPDLKDVSSGSLDRTIIVDKELFGPTPYRGGALDVNLTLLAVKSADLAGPFLEVLTGLASAAGVSYVKMAEPFLKPLADGIDLLSGTAGATGREVALVTSLALLRAGVYVVARAVKADLDLAKVRLSADYTLTDGAGSPVSDYPYLVISIEGSPDRIDFMGIPEVKAAYDPVKKAVADDDPKAYQDALTVFRRTVLLCDDLLTPHARKLFEDVKKKMDEIMGAPMTAAAPGKRQVPELGSFQPFTANGL
jgi:hypothetical protein